MKTWRILSSAYPIETPFLRLRADRIELPSGTVVEEYFVRESRGFCVVLALTPDDDVLLVRQYKHGIGEFVLELPAGMLEPDEAPAACAARELAEETGYTGAEPEFVRTFLADPTNSTGRFHLFVVRDARATVAPDPDLTEEIEVVLAPAGELRAMALDGRINAGSQVAAALVALEYLGR
ncbi:MAG TPA: NUDIX hydrolase [Candidatus Sulfotelmatobacter sp.]|nr:NUDIX hydrolase [Candidatus Sulfotelmatobacter sp.]